MLITTTTTLQDKKVLEYKGLVTNEVTAGINVARDIFAAVRNIFGGRVKSYEKEIGKIREIAIAELKEKADEKGANAIIGLRLEFETLNGMIVMVSAQGTAVKVENKK
jgi:uncharacterized protein YbjQ (UPF0145 family)